MYRSGQALFAVPQTQFGELDATHRELALLDTLYGTYKVRGFPQADNV